MLNGEIALVSGASRGIGAAIAERLGREGARVIGTATTAEGAARITENLSERGGRGAVLDVTSQESIDALISDIEGKEGAIGILCNNAGITRDGLLLRMKQDDWDAVMQTNLASVFRLSKAVLRGMMKARKGRIVSHYFGGRPDRQSRPGQLCRVQGRHPRFHQVSGPGGRLARDYGQRHRPRVHRHRHDARPERGAA